MFYKFGKNFFWCEDMNVNPINLNKNVNASQSQRAEKPVSSFEPEIQTSLYNTKGANVYFGSLAKGADVMEEQCVKILRAARDGMKRRFAENDIEDVLRILKPVKNSEEKPEIIKQVLTLDGEFAEKIPDRDMFKNLVKLIAQRPEHERFAILQFAENELQNSTKPMEIFTKLPNNVQDDLTKLLVKIDDVNVSFFFKDDDALRATIDSLYDTFRVALYGHYDMANMNKVFKTSYKNRNLEILKADRNFYDKSDGFKSESAKRFILNVVDEIIGYFEKNV